MDVDLEDESVYREREKAQLEHLVHPDIQNDVGCSITGQYELIGTSLPLPYPYPPTFPPPCTACSHRATAIVTHKGAAADSGHYMGFVKKAAIQADAPADDEDWYKFDDDKVSVFPKEKLATLDGGGEDSSAYVLLYRTKPLA